MLSSGFTANALDPPLNAANALDPLKGESADTLLAGLAFAPKAEVDPKPVEVDFPNDD